MSASSWWQALTQYDSGTSRPLSIPRKVVCDLLHFAKAVPTVPVQRVVNVSRLGDVRRAAGRAGWCAIFTKAFALLAREVPALRQAYVEYPRPRLYEHPFSVAAVAVERDYRGEPGVFFAQVKQPEDLPLSTIETAIRDARDRPFEEAFAWVFRAYQMPRFVRRALWWYLLNVRGSRKAQFFGTYGVSSYSSLGAESLHPLSPLTATLNYGVIGPDGRVTLRIVYDHRVMDGATVARALARLEAILNDEFSGNWLPFRPSPALRNDAVAARSATGPLVALHLAALTKSAHFPRLWAAIG